MLRFSSLLLCGKDFRRNMFRMKIPGTHWNIDTTGIRQQDLIFEMTFPTSHMTEVYTLNIKSCPDRDPAVILKTDIVIVIYSSPKLAKFL